MAENLETYYVMSFSSLKRVDSSIISFNNTPVCDTLKIVSVDISSLTAKPPYYGDTINLKFWGGMGLKIGSSSPPVYTLHNGWSYIYNRVKDTFIITDDLNNTIFNKSKIESIADFHVDFNVIKSHQFVILIGTGDESIPFIKPVIAKYEGDDFGVTDVTYVNSGVQDDYKICYNYDISKYEQFYTTTLLDELYSYDGFDISILPLYNVNDLKNMPATKIMNADIVVEIFDTQYLQLNSGKVLISKCTNSLYPYLFPIINNNDSSNNRPTYEPWMIWGGYDFIYPKYWDDDGDDFIIDIMDLSPNWA